MKDPLLCYGSYQVVVARMGVIEKIGREVYFEIAFEDHNPVLNDLTSNVYQSSIQRFVNKKTW